MNNERTNEIQIDNEPEVAFAEASELTVASLDLRRLAIDRLAVEQRIRALKREIRGTPLPWERNLWQDLRRDKAHATLLCAIAAHSRGRLHLQKCTRSHAHLGLPQIEQVSLAQQRDFIADRYRPYLRE